MVEKVQVVQKISILNRENTVKIPDEKTFDIFFDRAIIILVIDKV